MKNKYLPAILIIGYNRLEKIKNIIKIIKKNKKIRYVYFKIDGPKNKFDKDQIDKIQNILQEYKLTNKSIIYIKIEKKNLGLRKNIISGVNWVFKKEKKLIVLEDDNIPSLSFFNFCKKMLNFYEKDEKIMHISGTSFLKNRNDNDYYFSKIVDCVGWATWKNSWNKMIKNFDLNKTLDDKRFIKFFNTKEEEVWFSHYLFREVNTVNKKCLWTTWWQLSIIKNNGLCINPTKNLVTHDGYNIEDNPEHYNDKATIKNQYKNENILTAGFKKKKIIYNLKKDIDHFNLIKIIDPHFSYFKLKKWLFKLYFRKSLFKNRFSKTRLNS
jgi:hypothetical protein